MIKITATPTEAEAAVFIKNAEDFTSDTAKAPFIKKALKAIYYNKHICFRETINPKKTYFLNTSDSLADAPFFWYF
jgi:hypothetical protein